MTAIDKAKRWLEANAKNTALVIVPLAALSGAGESSAVADTIFAGASAEFSAVGSGVDSSTTGFGALPAFNTVMGAGAHGTAAFSGTSASAELKFVFSGDAGASSTPFAVSSIPVAWNFTFTPDQQGDSWSYSASTLINSTSTSKDFGSLTGTQTVSNSLMASTPLGADLTTWSVTLDILWSSSGSGGNTFHLGWDIPAGKTLDVNAIPRTPAPEPASWQLAMTPLLGGLALLLNRRRRRGQ